MHLNTSGLGTADYASALASLSGVGLRKARVYAMADHGYVSQHAADLMSEAQRKYHGCVPCRPADLFGVVHRTAVAWTRYPSRLLLAQQCGAIGWRLWAPPTPVVHVRADESSAFFGMAGNVVAVIDIDVSACDATWREVANSLLACKQLAPVLARPRAIVCVAGDGETPAMLAALDGVVRLDVTE